MQRDNDTGLTSNEVAERSHSNATQDTDASNSLCTHCRGPILATHLVDSTGESFCCQGCREVYALLNDKGWEQFYELLNESKTSAPRVTLSKEYENYLKTLKMPDGLSEVGCYKGAQHTVSLGTSEIQCAACGFLVENILRENSAIVGFELDFFHGELALSYASDQMHLAEILGSLSKFGFHFRIRNDNQPATPKINNDLLTRLAVSGASFANAMAFSLAGYFGLFQTMEIFWQRAFGWFAFLVAIPGAFYGGHVFLSGAWRAIKVKAFSLDITVSLGLILAFTVSLDSLARGKPELSYADTLAGLVFFLLIGRWAVNRFEASLMLRSRWFEALVPSRLRVLRGQDFIWIPTGDVQPGDCILLENGEYVPCDGILQVTMAEFETSILTGESRPCVLMPGKPVFAGYRVGRQSVQIKVTATPGTTRVAQLLESLGQLQSNRGENSHYREHIALGFTLFVTASALGAFVLHLNQGWHFAALTSASVFVISCSCALALALPISRGIGLKRAHYLGYHFRKQECLERLSQVRCVLFDKTGTLSLTQRKVRRWYWLNEAGNSIQREYFSRGLFFLTEHSRHPVSVSIHESLKSISGNLQSLAHSSIPILLSFKELPQLGIWGHLDSNEELVLIRWKGWSLFPSLFKTLNCEIPSEIQIPSSHSQDGEPTSAFFCNGKLMGAIWLDEEIRADVPIMMAELKMKGIHTALLSGDDPSRVKDFALACGIEDFKGGLSPEEKQMVAKSAKQKWGITLAVGDGFNDSLLLGEADLGLAIAGDLPMVAASADILFSGESPASLSQLLNLGKGVQRSLFYAYLVSGAYNLGAISLAFLGWVSPLAAALLMPLSSLSLCLTAWLIIPRPNRRPAKRV